LSVLHIISGLNVGGAEAMLKRLIESSPASTRDAAVVSLTSLGVIGESLRAQGVRVHTLGMSSALDAPLALWRLVRLVRQYQPRIVQTWMYHADLLGGLAARLAGSRAVVWGIRSTTLPGGPLSAIFWLVRLCAICSHIVPHRIICCARSVKEVHIKLGYPAHKMAVIPNGYNFAAFDRHLASRSKARMDLGIKEAEIVVGAIGRFDPQKDFHNFVTAASGLLAKRANVTYLMVGRDLEWANATLRAWIESTKRAKNFQLLGEQSDIPYFLSAMDIFCLSSKCGEGFPNVVAEAMAMGLPCVVTRVGDAADIVGVDDFVVPVSDPASLADALRRMCDLDPGERKRLGQKGANKVRTEYGIENIRKKYEEVYAEVAGN
jgi:glycosyltransferase involved in cell wall biosynthesis